MALSTSDPRDLERRLKDLWWSAAERLIQSGGNPTDVFKTMMDVGTLGFLGGPGMREAPGSGRQDAPGAAGNDQARPATAHQLP